MPNSQTHLSMVNDLLNRPAVCEAAPYLMDGPARSAFFLGAISPDVRAITSHSREDTHFYDIPPRDDRSAQAIMLDMYPDITQQAAHDDVQRAFVMGYITHLVMDEHWLKQIVMPYLYIEGKGWGIHHPNWRLYSILMTWMEYRAAKAVPSLALFQMSQAAPDDWLPFIEDKHLAKWRDRVFHRISRGGARLVSSLFATTNGMRPRTLERIVTSDDKMNHEAFGRVPRQALLDFEIACRDLGEQAILDYLEGTTT